MQLKKEIEKTGNWLFKWRSYIPLLFIGIILTSIKNFKYLDNSHNIDQIWEIFCLTISFLGLGIRIYTVGYTPRGTSGRNTKRQKAEELNMTGFYSLLRHPLYLGNFFIWLGISMFVHNLWITVMIILIFWLYYERIMFAEEAFLSEKFGERYRIWADKTPAFLPSFKNWEKPCGSFSVKKVLSNENNSFFAIICSFTFLELLGDLFVEKKFYLDFMWAVIFSIGFVIYSILRILKKRKLKYN